MNNKGFTLVELLATIVILGLVMGIASYGVISAINTSKDKSEAAFVKRLCGVIDSYLALKGEDLEIDNDNYVFENEEEGIKFKDIDLSDLVDSKIVSESDFINPKNKQSCYDASLGIAVYRNNNYVYYYEFDFSGVCGIGKVSTLPQ